MNRKTSLTNHHLSLTMLVLLLSATILPAQISQPHRYERKQKGFDDYFSVIPLKQEGLCLLRHKDKYNNGKRIWEFIIVDTTLTEKKTTEFELETRNNFIGYEYAPGYIYLLYRTGETNKNTLQLLEFTSAGDERNRYEIKPELDFKLTHFIKVGSKMIFGGYVSKDPVILIYEMTTNLIKVVPGFFQKENELVDLRANQNNTFNTILVDRSSREEKKFIFRTFDQDGELLLEDVVPIDDKKSLQTSITSTLEREELMVMGSWGDRQAKQSTGFFTLAIDPFAEQKIHYFDFASLSHFLDFMKPKRAERIRTNAEHDIKAGRNPAFINYVMPFKVEERRDGFLMLAEVYNPVNTSSPFNSPYGNPYGMSYGMSPYFYNPYYPGFYYPSRMYRPYSYGNNIKNADEIKTTQSVLMAFDGKGNLIWDQSMKIEDVSRTSLEQVSEFFYNMNKHEVVFMYKTKEGELKVKSIELDNNESTETTEKIQLEGADELRSEKEQEGGIRQWYNNAFYVWGYQTIKNAAREDRVRDVFYINKVEVR